MLNQFKESLYDKQVLVIVGLFLFWFFFFQRVNLFSSGFHFIDDHEILVIHSQLQTQSFLSTVADFIFHDYETGRLRPLFYAYRILETKIFGLNWAAWYYHNFILLSISSFLIYLSGRNFGFAIYTSLIFSLSINLGEQLISWCKFGTAETLGSFILCLYLFLESKKINHLRFDFAHNLFSFILLIFLTLIKESFLLSVPVIILVTNLLQSKVVSLNNIFVLNLRRNLLVCLVIIVELFYIKFVLSTNSLGYAGLDSESFKLTNIISVLQNLYLNSPFYIFLIFYLFFIIPLFKTFKSKFNLIFINLNRWILLIIISTFGILLQLLLYSKSGLVAHYLLPCLLFSNLSVFSYFQYLNISSNTQDKYTFRFLLILFTLFLCLNSYPSAFAVTRYYSVDGYSTTSFLNKLSKCLSSFDSDNKLLVIGNSLVHYEVLKSLKTYIDLALGQDQVYISLYGSRLENDFYSNKLQNSENFWYSSIPNSLIDVRQAYNNNTFKNIENLNQISTIVVISLEEDFKKYSKLWFDPSLFKRYEFILPNTGNIVVLYCKN